MADATNANDELYPIAVLIDELKVWAVTSSPPTPPTTSQVLPLINLLGSTTTSYSVSMLSTGFRLLPSPWARSAPARS